MTFTCQHTGKNFDLSLTDLCLSSEQIDQGSPLAGAAAAPPLKLATFVPSSLSASSRNISVGDLYEFELCLYQVLIHESREQGL